MAIKLEVEMDFSIHKSEVNGLSKNKEGIYVLVDRKKNPLYIGETKCIKTRVNSHINGFSNIRSYHKEIEFIQIIFESDFLKRKLIEAYLIGITPGILNVGKRYDGKMQVVEKSRDTFKDVRIFGDCQHLNCLRYANANGYCSKHGGNGISKEFIKNKAIEDFLAGKYNPKIEQTTKKHL